MSDIKDRLNAINEEEPKDESQESELEAMRKEIKEKLSEEQLEQILQEIRKEKKEPENNEIKVSVIDLNTISRNRTIHHEIPKSRKEENFNKIMDYIKNKNFKKNYEMFKEYKKNNLSLDSFRKNLNKDIDNFLK